MKVVEGAVKVSPCIDEYIPKDKPPRQFTETRPRPERKHLTANESDTWDNPGIGLKTFIDIHNRKSLNEYSAEERMGQKVRV